MPSLSLAHLNVRSLVAHFVDVKRLILANRYDIFCVSETWLNDNIQYSVVSIDGYVFYRQDRIGRAGGVGIYVRSDFKCQVLPTSHTIEHLWLKLQMGKISFAICAFYRPQDIYYRFFLTEFESAYALISPTVQYLFCLGDFNVDLLNIGSDTAQNVINILDGLGLKQIVTEPTRITAATCTLLDYIITSDEDVVEEVRNKHVPEVGDHELVSCVVSVTATAQQPIFKTLRNFKNFNYQQFKSDLMSLPWNIIYELSDVDSKVTLLNNNILTLLNIHAPFVTFRITKPYAPWLTDCIKAMMRDRDRALERFKHSRNLACWNTYKQLRNMTTATIRREKKAYFCNRVKNANSKGVWSALRSLGISSKGTSDLPEGLQDADAINDHFVTSIPNLSPDKSLLDFYNNNSKFDDNSFQVKPVDEIEILHIIEKIKSTATGLDGINILTIKLCVPFLLPYITHIINFCIQHSVVPECWKRAKIVPIPKIKSPSSLNDLRPISILPTFSKILERIMESQMQNYLHAKSIIPINQSGFQKGHSCATALLHITDDVINATDKNQLTLLVLLDFSKAFDTLNHEMLLSILKHIGIHETTINLFSSYLAGRSQSVVYSNKMSRFVVVDRGVPQGTILGPLLFKVYTSNFPEAFLSCKQHYYADDTQVYLSFDQREGEQAVAAVNFDLYNIASFSAKHCLILNHKKSSAMVFGKKRDREQFLLRFSNSVFVNNGMISFADCVKNLGLFIDSDLRFSQHITEKLKKSYMNLKLIYAHREFLDIKTKTLLCEALILSLFNFCDVVYGPCLTVFDSNRIQKVQNSCLRLIHGLRKYQHISHTLKISNWLNMEGRRYVHLACLFSDILRSQTPPYLYYKITYRTDVHNINIRFKNALTVPLHNSEFFKRSFSYNIASVLNRLPCEYVNLTKRQFKKKIRELAMSRQ